MKFKKRSFQELQDRFLKAVADHDIVSTTHDSIMIDATEEEALELHRALKEIFFGAAEVDISRVKIRRKNPRWDV